MNPTEYAVKLIKKEQASQDAVSFYFERPVGLDFYPGQYLKMFLDIPNPDDRGTTRFFSISSSPTELDHIMITTRIIQSTFKMALKELPVGSEVKIRAPHGNFILDEKDPRSKVFLTGGIGITPFRSMFVYAYDKKIPNIVLMASFSTSKDIVYLDELSKMQHDDLRLVYTITHPEEGNSWVGEVGRIDQNMVKKHVENPQESVYYIAGPQVMVDAMVGLVKEMGIAEENIKTENFPGY